jgi:hypothetical protein
MPRKGARYLIPRLMPRETRKTFPRNGICFSIELIRKMGRNPVL